MIIIKENNYNKRVLKRLLNRQIIVMRGHCNRKTEEQYLKTLIKWYNVLERKKNNPNEYIYL